jgi:hypothetical protein
MGEWDIQDMIHSGGSSLDIHLAGNEQEGSPFTSVRTIAKKGGLELPVEAGTRVEFVASLQSVLTYPDCPEDGVQGSVVTCRSASGDTTSDEGRVFAMWDDGQFRSILAEHLRPAETMHRHASAYRMVVADLGDLSSFFGSGFSRNGDNDLVHKATKDLWSYHKDGDKYVIERLFDETGKPLKV